MNYKKEKKQNYSLHLIKTDRFKEITVSIRFTKKYEKEEGAYLKLLERIIVQNGTKKYKKLKDISKKLESLYRTDIITKFFATSKNMTFETRLIFINPKYTEMNIYEEAFSLFKEVITNPNIKNNKWNEKTFNLEKENIIKSIQNVKDDPESYGRIKFDENFFKGTVYAENNYKNLKIFETIENEKLYETYKKLFTDYKIDVLVCGNYEEDIIKKEIDKLLNNFKENDSSTKELKINLKTKEKKEIKEQIETTGSNLFIGCTLDNLSLEEKDYKLILYNTILGTMNNSVLFVNVREKNSLCYRISSLLSKYTNTFIIESGINKKNYQKAIKIIEESIESMKDINVVKPLITNAKKTLEIAFNDFYENISKIIDYYFLNEFSYTPTIEERRTKVKEITAEEICEIANKVKIDTIFLLEGSLNEEN